MRCRPMNPLAQALLDSSRAAALVGPNMPSPLSANASTMPAASGASGPTMVKQSRSAAKSASPWMSSGCIGMLLGVPPLPGAVYTASTISLCDTLQASACSRPPDPTTSTLAIGAARRDGSYMCGGDSRRFIRANLWRVQDESVYMLQADSNQNPHNLAVSAPKNT